MSGNVPNTPPPITSGEVWTPAQWTNAWMQKVDVNGGSAQYLTILNAPVINVLDHGAKGDGTTDDTAAIQGVLNTYAGRATVFIPFTGANFRTTTLNIPSNTDLLLTGSLQALPGLTTAYINCQTKVNIVIRGVGTIDANKAAQTNPGGTAPLAGLAIALCGNVRVWGITLTNAWYWNLNVTQSNNVVIERCSFTTGGAANEFAAGSADCWLTNCALDGTGLGDYLFAFYGGVTNSGIIGCTLQNAGAGTAQNPPGIGVLSDTAQPAPCHNILIANNIVHDSQGAGISCQGSTAGLSTGIVITGNRSYNNVKSGWVAGADIFFDYVSEVTVNGNSISNNGNVTGPYFTGIFIGGHCGPGFNITSNQVFNVGAGLGGPATGGNTNAGLYAQNPTYCYVGNNHFYDDQTTPTMQASIVGGFLAHCSLVGNTSEYPITAGYSADTVLANAGTSGNFFSLGVNTTFQSAAPQMITNHGGNARWFSGQDGSTESGGSSGSNYEIVSVSDGNVETQAFAINRATGLVSLYGGISLTNLTSNLIQYTVNGVGPPTFTTRSVGTKLALWPDVGASSVDYAVGIANNTLWHSVPQNLNTLSFAWYGGTTQIASLDGTGNLNVAGTTTSQYWRGPGSTYTFGASLPSYISYLNANYTGAYTGGSANTVPYLWDITGDSADLRNFNAGFPVAQFNHSFGGTGTYGGRTGVRVFVNTVGNFNDTVTTQQHVGAELWMQMAHNAGGVSGTPAGYAYAANPQVLLLPGASYWSQANALGEINIGITASNQPVTVGGTVENGDTLSITFASSVISGSPVTVSCTTSASQTLAMVANNLVAAVNSSVALQNARVAATRNGNVVELWWQGQDTVSPSVTSGVAATLTLGSFVQGASVQDKAMATMIRLAGDGGDGINTSYFLAIGSQSAPTSGQMRYGIAVGAEWSIRRDGTIFGVTSPQTAHGGTGRSDPFPPQFCAYGVDMFYANFSKESGAGYRSVGMVDRANGVLELRNTKLTASSTGMAMDVTGLVASAVAISSGGGGGAGNPQNNYFPGDLIGDNYGGQYEITAVNTSTGAATAFNVLVYPATTGSTPSNPVSTFGGSGTGLTLTITWPGAGALSLNPGGAAVQLGSGCFTANGSTAVSLTSIAPSGAHATVQEWLTVKDASGTVRYIPCF